MSSPTDAADIVTSGPLSASVGNTGAAGWRSMHTQLDIDGETGVDGFGQHGCDGDEVPGVPAQIPAGLASRNAIPRIAQITRNLPVSCISLHRRLCTQRA